MENEETHLAVCAQSWVRQDNYIKVPHPQSLRPVFLSNEQADVFERIDDGLDFDEILNELSAIYDGFSRTDLQNVISLLIKLELVAVTDQFG